MSARQRGDALVADHAQTVLRLSQAKYVPTTREIVSYTHALTGFKGELSLRIIRIRLALNYRMPTDRHPGGAKEGHVIALSFRAYNLQKNTQWFSPLVRKSLSESNAVFYAGVVPTPTAIAG